MHDLTRNCPVELTWAKSTSCKQVPEVNRLSSLNEQVRVDEQFGDSYVSSKQTKQACSVGQAEMGVASKTTNLKMTHVVFSPTLSASR